MVIITGTDLTFVRLLFVGMKNMLMSLLRLTRNLHAGITCQENISPNYDIGTSWSS